MELDGAAAPAQAAFHFGKLDAGAFPGRIKRLPRSRLPALGFGRVAKVFRRSAAQGWDRLPPSAPLFCEIGKPSLAAGSNFRGSVPQAAGATMATAVQRLRAIHLYRHSLKNMLSWAVRREVFYVEVRNRPLQRLLAEGRRRGQGAGLQAGRAAAHQFLRACQPAAAVHSLTCLNIHTAAAIQAPGGV